MKIEADYIIVKSDPEYYQKEKDGSKNNTCRTLKSITEDGLTVKDLKKCTYVTVINSATGNQFVRELSDISVFGDIVIISWYGE